jgi:hypothetical protein
MLSANSVSFFLTSHTTRQGSELFLLLKLLAGRPHEASRLIGSHYFAKGLEKIRK